MVLFTKEYFPDISILLSAPNFPMLFLISTIASSCYFCVQSTKTQLFICLSV
jgi:hypothetical protein